MADEAGGRRRLRLALLVTGVCLVILAVGLHTPPVRKLVLRRALGALPEDRFAVAAGHLDYRLHRLWFRVEGLSVAAAGHEERPFFAADAVEVDLPWSILTGDIALQDLTLVAPQIRVEVDEDGGTNLPTGGEPYRGSVMIERLEVRRMSLRWRQPGSGLLVDARDLGALLEPESGGGIAGPLQMPDPAELRIGQVRWPLRIDGVGTWDGRDVGLRPLRLETPAAELEIDGTVGPVLAEPELDLQADLRTRLDELGRVLDRPLSGTVTADVRLTGPAATPSGSVAARSEGLGWHDLQTGPTTLTLALRPDAVAVTELTTTLAGARLRAEGQLGLAAGVGSELRLRWEDLDPAVFADTLGTAAPVRPATTLEGSATLRWPGLDWRRGTLVARTRAVAASAAPDTVPLAGDLELRVDLGDGSWNLDTDLSGGDGARLEAHLDGSISADAPTEGTVSGRVRAELPELRPWAELARSLPGLADAGAGLQGVRGGLRIDGALSGSLGTPAFDGRLVGTALGADALPVPPLDVDARIRADPERLDVTDLLLGSGANQVRGRVALALASRSLDVDVTADLDAPGALLEPWLSATGLAADDIGGTLDARVRLRGSVDRPAGEVSMTGASLRVGGWGPAELELEATVTPRDRTGPGSVLRLDAARLETAQGRLSGTARIGLTDGTIDGDLEVDIDELGPWAALAEATGIPVPEPVAGTVDGTVRIAGNLVAPRLDVRLRGENLRVGGWGPGRFAADGRLLPGGDGLLADGRVLLERARLEDASGWVEVRAEMGLGDGTIGGNLRAEIDELGPWARLAGAAGGEIAPATSGSLTADLDLGGDLRSPWLDGELRVADLRVDGVGPLALDVHLRHGDDATTATLRLTTAGLEIQGRSLPDLLAEANLTVAPGPAPEIDVELRALRVDLAPSPLALDAPARAHYGDGVLRVEGLRLRAGASRLRVAGAIGTTDAPGLEIDLEADLQDLREILEPLMAATTPGDPSDGVAPASPPPEAPTGSDAIVAGQVAARLVVRGTLSAPEIHGQARLENGRLEVAGFPPLERIGAALEGDGSTVRLVRADASWLDAEIGAEGELPLGLLRSPADRSRTARLSVRVGRITVDALRPLLPADLAVDAQGTLALRAELEATAATLDAVRGRLVAETLDLRLAGQTLRQAAPTSLRLADGRLHVEEWRWEQLANGGSASRITVGGSAGLEPGAPVDLKIAGELRLRWMSAFLTGAALDGTADIDAEIGGRLDAPTFAGHIRVHRGQYAQSEPRILVSELDGEISLQGRRLVAEGLQGRINGGRLMISGDLRIDDDGQPSGLLGLTVRNAAVALDEVRAETDVDLSLSLEGLRQTRLFGSVTLLRGAYRSDRPVTEELVRLLREQAVTDEAESALDEMRLQVRVRSADDLRIDSRLAELAMAVDLQVVGTLAQPAVLGRVDMREGGEVYLGTNTYTVERGSIDFSSPSAIEPVLDVEAQTRVGAIEITLSITGRAEEPRIDVTSDPPHDPGDIYALLATGRTLQEAGGAETAVLREQALGVLATQFLGTAGQAVGLDAVRIERAAPVQRYRPDPDLLSDDTDLASRLTLRKAITPDFTLIFSQNLGAEDQRTWVGRYSLPWNLTFQGVKFDDDTRAAALRHRFSFGGGDSRREEPEQRIGEIRLLGDPILAEQEIRDRLRLEAGDRFEFWRWQEDAERLRRLYHEQGYREARVSARRETTTGGEAADPRRLTLVYEIEPGPETRLEVSGHDLPGRVRRRIEEAWSESILREFLVDDVETIVREHLVRSGHLRAEVDVRIDGGTNEAGAGPDVTVLGVHVTPGPRTSDRRLVFTGNRRLDTDTLQATLEQRDLTHVAWVDPGRVETALLRRYAESGMPEAEITVGEPVFEGDRARREVVVREGPVHRLAGVELEGVTALTEEELAEPLSTATAGPWTGERLLTTRRAVADAYRSRGFNTVDIEARTTLRDGERVLHLRIQEGPREIIRSIEVEGTEATRRSVIDRNIVLRVGDPLVMADVYETRRRLYDAGVFRSVRAEVEPAGPAESGERPMDVTFQVIEEPRFRIESGLEVLDEAIGDGTRDRKLGVSLNLVHDNFLGRAVSLGASGRLRKDQQVARFYVSAPRFLGLPLASTVSLSRFHELIGGADELFRLDRSVTQLTAEQRLPLISEWSLSYSVNWQRNDSFFPNQDPDDPFSLEGDSIDLVRLNTSLVRDTRDDELDARRGLFHASTFEWSAPPLGSDEKFTKYLGHQYYFWTPAPRVVVASALRVGSANAFGSELIPFERFRAGGSTTVRGYPDGLLGSIDVSGGPVPGGNAMLILNQEIRFPLWRWFRGVTFVDAGSTFEAVTDIRPADLFYSTGVGLRAHTPLLLLRLDLAMRLSDFEDEPRFRLHFGIGQVF